MLNTFYNPIIPAKDTLRLKALEYFDILAELPDRYFTNLAHIIALAFHSDIALVSLVDEEEVVSVFCKRLNVVGNSDSM